MPKFAIFYVPQASDLCYQLGSQLLGYDMREQRDRELSPELQHYFEQFDAAWTAESQPYGFHLTISDALDCSWTTIPQVERELAGLLACFRRT